VQLSEFIGQKHIIEDLGIHMGHSMLTGTPLEHTMFYGNAGFGKTTLAKVIAGHMGYSIIQKTGQELTKKALYEIFGELNNCDVLFVDEIHNTPTKTLEILYGPLQIINDMKVEEDVSDFEFEEFSIEPFTLIGATTSAGSVTKPLRDRIVLSYCMTPYSCAELISVLTNKDCPINAAEIIANRARGVPRIALNYFLRIRNEVMAREQITPSLCEQVFNRLGISANGFTENDFKVLAYLQENGVVGQSELCRSLNIDTEDFLDMYEPFLLNNKLLKISSRGRALTKRGEKLVMERCS